MDDDQNGFHGILQQRPTGPDKALLLARYGKAKLQTKDHRHCFKPTGPEKWQELGDSNPRPAVLETAALAS
jgi:hypothetical protein